jgi:hypothetical protein
VRKFVGGAKRSMSWESFIAALIFVNKYTCMCVKEKKNKKPM